MTTYSGELFAWRKEEYVDVWVGSTTISDLNDAALVRMFRTNQSFQVQSHRTSRLKVFTPYGGEQTVDGEVICWTYGADYSPFGYPRIIIKIYND